MGIPKDICHQSARFREVSVQLAKRTEDASYIVTVLKIKPLRKGLECSRSQSFGGLFGEVLRRS